METLPIEILNIILHFVDRPSLFHSSLVSHQWRACSLEQVVTISSEKELREVCKRGDLLSVVRSRFNKKWINWGLYGTCEGGQIEVALLMIEKGADDWNLGLSGACEGGQIEMALLMIKKGADDWSGGLYYACEGGQIEMALLMIEKGAKDLNWGLYWACKAEQREMALFMIEKGAKDWNRGLSGACKGRKGEMALLMIEKGATQCYYCRKSMADHLSNKD